MSRFIPNRYRSPSSEVVILTGGLNTSVTALELKPGELIDVKNLMEIDGISHGYTSIPGYEAYDGTTYTTPDGLVTTSLPSEVPLEILSSYSEVPDVYGSVSYYAIGDYVQSGGYKFQCVKTHNISDPGALAPDTTPVSNTYWAYIGAVVGKQYYVDDRVSYKGFPYVCILAHTASTTNRPAYLPPGDNTWWVCEDKSALPTWDATTEYLTGDIIEDATGAYVEAIKESINIPTTNTEYWKENTTTHHTSLVDTFKDVRREAFRSTIQAVGVSDGAHGPIKFVHQYNNLLFAIRSSLTAGLDSLYVATSSGWSLIKNDIPEGDNYSAVNGRLSRFNGNAYTCFFTNDGSNNVFYTDGTIPGTSSFAGPSSTLNPTRITIFKNRLLLSYPDGTLTFSTVGLYGSTTTDYKVYFSAGTYAFEEGETITETTSGNTAVVVNTVVESGTFATNDASGYFLLDTLSGPFGSGQPLSGSVAGAATSATSSFNISIWDASAGAGQIDVGSNIVEMVESVGGVLVLYLELGTKLLYYTGDFNQFGDPLIYKLDTFSDTSSTKSRSVAKIFNVLYSAEERGITNLTASNAFGDFAADAVSKKVNEFYLENKDNLTATSVNLKYNQYRIFFNNKALYFTFTEGKLKGATVVELLDDVLTISSAEDDMGNINTYFGSNDGFVYKMDSGTSFNGNDIETYMMTSFFHYGTPSLFKRFHSIAIEAIGGKNVQFDIRTAYDYNDISFPRNIFSSTIGVGSGGVWGQGIWGVFLYGGAVVERIMFQTFGVGTNMGVELKTKSKYNEGFTLKNLLVTYTRMGRRL